MSMEATTIPLENPRIEPETPLHEVKEAEPTVLANSRGLRMVDFFSLYAIQGIVGGFGSVTLVNAFAANGSSVTAIGRFLAIIGIPWIFQFAWGPVIDAFPNFLMGRRRFWIMIALVLSNISLLALFMVPGIGHELDPFAYILLVNGVFGSMLYVASDGMVVDQVPEADYGLNSAVTRGGFIIGTSASVGLFSWTLEHWGYQSTIFVMLGARIALSFIPLFCREQTHDAWFSLRRRTREETAKVRQRFSPRLAHFAKVLVLRLTQFNSVLAFTMGFLVNFAFSVQQLHFVTNVIQTQHWSQTHLSQVQAAITFVSGTLGALAVGKLLDLVGYRKLLTSLLLVSGAIVGAYAYTLTHGGVGGSSTLTFLIAMLPLPGFVFVAMMPAAMALSRGMAAATQFTLFMTIMNLGDIAGAACSGWLHEQVQPWQVAVGVASLLVLLTPCILFARKTAHSL